MIVSFNPLVVGHVNRLVAGRAPDDADLAAIRSADAVILPQGCGAALYRMAAAHCPNVFPDFSARFDYPGKTGQARLFARTGARHPPTLVFGSVAEAPAPPMPLPFVFKLDWGGEGETVSLISDADAYRAALEKAALAERSGHGGFIAQALIPSGGRSVRVAVIGTRRIAYWRVAVAGGDRFKASLAAGGTIDRKSRPAQLAAATEAVDGLCRKTGINLAGIDLLFADNETDNIPLFLEINYFFGRNGLGGSPVFYQLFTEAVNEWLATLGMSIDHV